MTGPAGRFDFPEFIGTGRVVVRRIGAAPISVSVAAAPGNIGTVLFGAPVEMQSLEIRGGCSNKEDREARRIWERAATRYTALPRSLIMETTFKLVEERIPLAAVGRPNSDSSGYGTIGARGELHMTRSEARFARSGYAAPDPQRDDWRSLGIAPWDLQHLVSRSFGERVRFTVLEGNRIRFCPRDRGKPWVEGQLAFAEDTTLLWGNWAHRSRVEGWPTGVVVTFAAPSPQYDRPLVPTSYLLWQGRGSGMAVQVVEEYRDWAFLPPYGAYLGR